MANGLTKISKSLLPMEDIKVAMNDEFLLKTENAQDTNKVAGEESEKIALAAAVEEGDPIDRNTVENSLKLGGVEAENYLTNEDKNGLEEVQENIKDTYSSEVRSIRDELYQLKAELTRRGLVTNYLPYSGFQDVFINNDPLHLKDSIANLIEVTDLDPKIAIINNEDANELSEGDIVVFHFIDVSNLHRYQINKIVNILDSTTLEFEDAISSDFKNRSIAVTLDPDLESVKIYKSLGMIHNGTFSFMHQEEDAVSPHENHSSLVGDVNNYFSTRPIALPGRGFGYTFAVSKFMLNDIETNEEDLKDEGFLTKIKLKVTRLGNPGGLMAYIIHQNDIVNFRDSAESSDLIIGQSELLTIHNDHVGKERVVTFNFNDGAGKYPRLQADNHYCVIIEGQENIDATNYYMIKLVHPSAEQVDLHRGNKLYEYTRSGNPALVTSSAIDSGDLFHVIITTPIDERTNIPYSQGLYTSTIKLQEPIEISRARLMLRINREGYFVTDYEDKGYVALNLNIKTEDGNVMDSEGIGSKSEDDIIVGSSIRSRTAQDQFGITLNQGVYLEKGNIDVYRMGYKVYLKAIKRGNYNPINKRYEIEESQRIELDLSAVMLDRIKKSKKVSDRLIFENLFTEEVLGITSPKYYDEFELQVYWNGGNLLSSSDDFIGRIHDLNLTFDKSI